MPRRIARDHVRYMVHRGRVVGVMTQPYGIVDLGGQADKPAELVAARYAVDVCPPCSAPGYALAVIHYRPRRQPTAAARAGHHPYPASDRDGFPVLTRG